MTPETRQLLSQGAATLDERQLLAQRAATYGDVGQSLTDEEQERRIAELYLASLNNKHGTYAILSQRGATHGDFGDNATCALQIREVMRSMKPHWSNCTAEQRLALEEIALKIARILSGGNKVAEHWLDIQGYAKLGEKACTTIS